MKENVREIGIKVTTTTRTRTIRNEEERAIERNIVSLSEVYSVRAPRTSRRAE